MLCPLDAALVDHSRVSLRTSPGVGIRFWEFGLLLAGGVAAIVLSDLVEFKLKLPGHAIIRSVVPLSLSLALVPRRGGGSVLALGAAIGAVALRGSGWNTGLGAITSAVLFGPLIDLMMLWTRRGWQLYLAFGLAGLATNLGAFLVQLSSKWLATGGGRGGGGGGGGLGGGGGGGRNFADWLAVASWSYPVCGFAAGLVCAAIWFRLYDRRPSGGDEAGRTSN